MRFHEKFQHKARNYLYEVERAKKKEQNSSRTNLMDIWQFIVETVEEVDEYLDEKINEYKDSQKSHNK